MLAAGKAGGSSTAYDGGGQYSRAAVHCEADQRCSIIPRSAACCH